MRHLALLSAALLAWAYPACAGPWARGQGNAFISSSASATWPSGRSFDLPDVYGSGYAEYGLTERLTLGLEAGSPDYQAVNRAKAIAFLRYTLTDASATMQYAVDVGGGYDQGEGVVRLGGSLGRGFVIGYASGWMTLDGKMLFARSTARSAYGLDLTIGVNQKRAKYVAQLSAFQAYDGKPFVSLTPSLVRQVSKNTHIEFGATLGLKNKPDPALKIGIWQEF